MPKGTDFPVLRAGAQALALFRSLCYGADAEFLAAADTPTKRLIGQMDRRTASGLLASRARLRHPGTAGHPATSSSAATDTPT